MGAHLQLMFKPGGKESAFKDCYPSTIDVGACLTFITTGHEHKGFSFSEPAVFISSSAVGQI